MRVRVRGRHRAAPPIRPRRWPWAVVAAALLTLAATVPLVLLQDVGTPQASVPLPAVSIPQPPTETNQPASRRPVRSVAQARKASPSASVSSSVPAPALLGPTEAGGLPRLLTSYCRETVGRSTLAFLTGGSWSCGRAHRDPVPIAMNAMCGWRYGTGAYATRDDDTDPTGWRCYRDRP
ncbi:hypothetical protein AB0M36_29920 [Actinoplanes sp. NPDC051346]|uniref:hypothetical protein n=1 Tax=Actinoplanes sp. NPDC051346 TaxID=3155048 RepID=UPI00341BF751